MSYLGRSAKLSLKAQEKVSFLATAGQTVKTGLSYVPSFVEVYVNGVLLTDTTDFTATNGNSITFTVALLLNDEVTVISLKTFTVADHYNKAEAGQLLAAMLPKAGGTMTGVIAGFESTGIDDNATSTAVTIDASENVMVGQTSINIANNGHSFGANGNYAHHTSTESTTLILNRKTNDGDIVRLRKDNGAVGSIGTRGGNLSIGSGDVSLEFNASNDALLPSSTTTNNTRDAAVDLGISSVRFKDAYLSGGVYLGGTGAANKLDDYEEGTWTATVASGTVVASDCRYTKIGSMVHLMGTLSTWSDNTSNATIDIGSLPFISISGTSSAIGPVMPRYFNVNSGTYNMNVYLRQASNTIRLYHTIDNGSYYAGQHSDCNGPTAHLRFQLTYRTTQ